MPRWPATAGSCRPCWQQCTSSKGSSRQTCHSSRFELTGVSPQPCPIHTLLTAAAQRAPDQPARPPRRFSATASGASTSTSCRSCPCWQWMAPHPAAARLAPPQGAHLPAGHLCSHAPPAPRCLLAWPWGRLCPLQRRCWPASAVARAQSHCCRLLGRLSSSAAWRATWSAWRQLLSCSTGRCMCVAQWLPHQHQAAPPSKAAAALQAACASARTLRGATWQQLCRWQSASSTYSWLPTRASGGRPSPATGFVGAFRQLAARQARPGLTCFDPAGWPGPQ